MSVKEHFEKYKTQYIVAGSVIVAVTVTYFVTKSLTSTPRISSGRDTTINSTIVNFVERSTPIKPVHLVGTDLYFDSLSKAARETGHPLSQISKNVNGHIPDVNGDVFELLQAA